MTAEISTPVLEDEPLMPPTLVAPPIDPASDKPARRAKKVEDEDGEGVEAKPTRTPLSPELKRVQAAEDGDFRDVLENIGTDGSFRIVVTRVEPEQARDPATGRMVKVDGHLKTYTQAIDQEFIASRHGGGKFRLNFLKKAADGSYKIHTKRVIDIAGDPRTDDVPRNVDPVAPAGAPMGAAPASDSPSIVRDVLGVMKDQLDKSNERASRANGPAGPDPAMMLLIEELRRTNETQATEMRELRREMADTRNAKPEKSEGDAFKDGLVKQLLDGDSSRLQATRIQFESEIRQLKDLHQADIARLYERFERDVTKLEAAHMRELALVRTSNDTTQAAIKISLDTSKEVLNGQIKALERECSTLRTEVSELRAKKDKSPLEIAKEYKVLQETYGAGDDKDEASTVEKVVTALPQAIEIARDIMNKNKPAAPQQAAPVQPARPQILQMPNGDKFIQRGNDLIPVKKKGQKVAVTAGEGQPPTEVEIPAIDPGQLEQALSYLERAFNGNQDPAVVAQSAKPFMPDAMMTSIQTLGIDVFFAKVAKLPSASPLSSQAGKNWIRKVGKALVGE